jgi:hypothetical protein
MMEGEERGSVSSILQTIILQTLSYLQKSHMPHKPP